MFRRPVYKVEIDGNDVTDRFAPVVKTISVTKNSKRSAHTAEILLADPDGSTFFPQDGAKVKIFMGTEEDGADLVFEGTVNDVNSSGAKGSGRELTISATSADQKGKLKEQALRHKDDAKLEEVAKEWATKAELEMQVIGDLAQEERPYWSMMNESFQQWGLRIAEELGATFLIEGKRAIMAPRNEGVSASGKPLTTINAAFGDNLISWDISPIIGRPQYQDVQVRYYDTKEAKWKTEKVGVRDANAKVKLTDHAPVASQSDAKAKAKAGAKKSEREKGSGSVTILGDYAAQPEAPCVVSGTREGVDGDYIVDTVTHSIEKSGGFTSKLTLKKPSGKAGKDSRKATSPSQKTTATGRDPKPQGAFPTGGQ